MSIHYSDDIRSSKDNRDPSDQEVTGFLEEFPVKAEYEKKSKWQAQRCLVILAVLNGALFVVSAILFGTWYYQSHLTKNPGLRNISIYSPLYDAIDLDIHTIQVNGTFSPPKDPTIARQLPNPAADAVWEDYEKVRPIPLTSSQIARIGKDPTTVAKFEDKLWGLGSDAYLADLDVFHQLHCLNVLRQYAYADYYKKKPLNASDVHSHANMHLNHCVDMLMTAIKCSGNGGFITSHWIPDVEYPQPDMSINRKCIDFERLVEWRNNNTIDLDKYEKVMANP
ncbi:hypothetical protein F5Y14DRAFT_455539 [Nemania sp. NC0429]|nr:hypothetical protein F5Y14DRAFT_455539 [Nemania sp. NC0429]